MNGGGAFLRRSLRSTPLTTSGVDLMMPSTSRARPSCDSSAFLPSSLLNLAVNGGGVAPSTCTSTDQYSCGRKAVISASRSAMSRTATDCTRPADRPRRTFVHSTGLIW